MVIAHSRIRCSRVFTAFHPSWWKGGWAGLDLLQPFDSAFLLLHPLDLSERLAHQAGVIFDSRLHGVQPPHQFPLLVKQRCRHLFHLLYHPHVLLSFVHECLEVDLRFLRLVRRADAGRWQMQVLYGIRQTPRNSCVTGNRCNEYEDTQLQRS